MSKIKKLQSPWIAEQSASNCISIIDDEHTICEITTEDDLNEDQWKIARMIEMTPLMVDMIKLGNTSNKDKINSYLQILKYIENGK